MNEWESFVDFFVFILDVTATLLIVHGAVLSIAKVIGADVFRKEGAQFEVKRVFIQKIILSLDFFVASDLLKLMLHTSFDEIVSIFLIVIIRTVLWWSLHKEIEPPSEEKKKK